MKCELITKSPVHIYSGEDYTSAEYCNSKRKFIFKNVEKEFHTIEKVNVSKYYNNLPSDKKEELLEQLMEKNFRLDDFITTHDARKYSQYYLIGSNTNHTDIKEHARTLNETYIPGSSIKGAIETAILNNYFEGYPNKNTHKLTKNVNNLPKNGRNNIFRFLRISDTNTTTSIKNNIECTYILKAESNGQMKYHTLHNNIVTEHIETIIKGTKLNFNINNKADDKILEKLDLKDKKNYINLKNIQENLYKFADEQINAELEYIEKYNKTNNNMIKQQINNFKEFYTKLAQENSIEHPMIRIGFGGGFLNKTISLKIKENPDDYDSFIKNLKYVIKRLKIYQYEFPKTRKITSKGIPLGWTQLKINEE